MRALDIQPERAGQYFRRFGRLMDAALATRRELEVLDGIGHVDQAAIDARLLHGPVHHLTAGPTNGRPIVSS